MRLPYMRAVLVGLGAACIAAVAWVVAVAILPLYVQAAIAMLQGQGGGAFTSVGGGSTLLAGFVGFVIGVLVTLWRAQTSVTRRDEAAASAGPRS